mmetsp:Transcript_19645/g.78173  ORF Transcript_19645/g.78173 Transcript_19645/m.78173 type:complete len:137 (-) Transcript_19645:844-1254(-)
MGDVSGTASGGAHPPARPADDHETTDGAPDEAASPAEVIRRVLRDCGAAPTGRGLVADARLAAELAGVAFTTVRATAAELARLFGIGADDAATGGDASSWEARVVEANARGSAFGEDDAAARRLAADLGLLDARPR